MGTFRVISRKELRARKSLTGRELKIFDEFRGYLESLDMSSVGVYELSVSESGDEVVKILRKVAKILQVKIKTIVEDRTVMFYRRKPRKR